MDQSIVKAILAPTKLAWKSQLGRDLDASYGINKSNAARFPGAITATIAFSGKLEGKALIVLSRASAKNVEGLYEEAFDEELTEKTISSVTKLLGTVVVNIPKLLAIGGYECTAELTGVANTTDKGISNVDEWAAAARLKTSSEFDLGEDTDEIYVWADVEHVEDSNDSDALNGDQKEILNGIRDDLDSMPSGSLYEGDITGLTVAEAKRAKLRGEVAGGSVVRTIEKMVDDEIHVLPEVKVGIVNVERLELVGPDGKSRTVLGTLEDGSPFLSMADEEGHVRTTFRLDEAGNPSLIFVDDIGAETWIAPRDMAPIVEPYYPPPPVAPPPTAPHGGPPRRRPPPPPPPGRGRPLRGGPPPRRGAPGQRPPAPGQRPPPARRPAPPGRRPAPAAGRRPAPPGRPKGR
ncbi:MAG: hypothetical protein HQ478_16605 [Chloroflexi bacterium]|nr:hypothetical protein [Chloroflexota bacterium]